MAEMRDLAHPEKWGTVALTHVFCHRHKHRYEIFEERVGIQASSDWFSTSSTHFIYYSLKSGIWHIFTEKRGNILSLRLKYSVTSRSVGDILGKVRHSGLSFRISFIQAFSLK